MHFLLGMFLICHFSVTLQICQFMFECFLPLDRGQQEDNLRPDGARHPGIRPEGRGTEQDRRHEGTDK